MLLNHFISRCTSRVSTISAPIAPTTHPRPRRNSLPAVTVPTPSPRVDPRRNSLPRTSPVPTPPYTGPGARIRARTQPDPSPSVAKRKPSTSTYMVADLALQEFGRSRTRQRQRSPTRQTDDSASTHPSPIRNLTTPPAP